MARLLRRLHNVVGKGLHVAIRRPRRHDQVIHDAGQVADIEDDGVDGLEVGKRLLDESDDACGVVGRFTASAV
jgi:hypothetical protein